MQTLLLQPMLYGMLFVFLSVCFCDMLVYCVESAEHTIKSSFLGGLSNIMMKFRRSHHLRRRQIQVGY